MPNTFAPRAYATVVKSRTQSLRMEHSSETDSDERLSGDVKEWHAMVDMLKPEYQEQFVEEYTDRKIDKMPDVVELPTDDEGE